MSAITIDTRQLKSLDKKLKRVFKTFPKDVDNTLKNTGVQVAGEVWRKTPKDTGSLTQSIQSEKKGSLTYVVTSRNKDAKGKRTEQYVDVVERGRGKRLKTSKNRNTNASANGSGAYKMFEKTGKKARKFLKDNFTTLLKRLARKI